MCALQPRSIDPAEVGVARSGLDLWVWAICVLSLGALGVSQSNSPDREVTTTFGRVTTSCLLYKSKTSLDSRKDSWQRSKKRHFLEKSCRPAFETAALILVLWRVIPRLHSPHWDSSAGGLSRSLLFNTVATSHIYLNCDESS